MRAGRRHRRRRPQDRIETDCEVVSRRIHRDRHVDPDGQHESEVEPDSLHRRRDDGRRVPGRPAAATGGATSIGFSTSKDGGRTWRQGLLPGLTVNSVPPGPAERASDPVVAYDAAHGVWLANSLSISTGATRLTIHRSTDGLTWSAPIDAALAQRESLAYDKNWLTCDNGARQPVPRPLLPGVHARRARRDDASRCSAPTTAAAPGRRRSPLRTIVTGVIPVVLPNGRLVLVFWSDRTGMVSVTSSDGGVTLERAGR